MKKRVAVVILNWNGKALLERYLPQVVANSQCDDAEIIVADNASTDDSLSFIAENFPTVKTIVLDRNYGFAGGYNRAIELVDNEFVLLLNSDVAPSENWLSPLLDVMDGDSTVAACAPKIKDDKRPEYFEYAGAAGGYLDWLCYPFCRGRMMDELEADNGQYDDNASVLWVSGAAMLVRTELFKRSGGFDEDFFAHMEEIDLCWRLKSMGYRLIACGASEVFHLGGATLSNTNPRKTFLNFRNNLQMLVKNYNSACWVLVLFVRLVLDGVAGVKFLAEGKWQFCVAIVKAHWALFATFGGVLRKRKALKSIRSKRLPDEVKRYSLIWNFYIKKRRTFAN